MGDFLSSVLETGTGLTHWPFGIKTECGTCSDTYRKVPVTPEQEILGQYSQAFFGLAELFQDMPCQKERLGDKEVEALLAQVQKEICTDCEQATVCWGKQYAQVCRIWYEMVVQLETRGTVGKEQREKIASVCLCPRQMEESLRESFIQARMTLMWNNRMMEQRMAVGEQILQTARLLHEAADRFRGMPELETKTGKKLSRELRGMDVILSGIRIMAGEQGRKEIYLVLYSDKKSCISAKTIGEVLSGCCGEKMQPAWNCQAAVGSCPASFHFVLETRYQIRCGISRITKAGEMVSGDNFAFLQKDTGRVVMSLADGMGSGAEACRESEKVIELLEQFLDAGFSQETTVRMINSCMLLQSSSQRFSTIDLCMIDLYNGQCNLLKYGASSTFILRGNEIEVLGCSAFPAGVMQQSDYESTHRSLQSGDTVIMMTDGVLDALPEQDRERQMAELIGKTAGRNAREFARRLMEKVYLMQQLEAKDDMTILIGTIWAKA